MKRSSLFAVVASFAVLSMGPAILGCGNNTNTDTASELAALATACNDLCNAAVSCVEEGYVDAGVPLSDEVLQASLEECLSTCADPTSNGEDVETRDCALDCDISSDCDTFTSCLCDCGPAGFEECV